MIDGMDHVDILDIKIAKLEDRIEKLEHFIEVLTSELEDELGDPYSIPDGRIPY